MHINRLFLSFLFLGAHSLWANSSNLENLRWYYSVDLWAYQPQLELNSYNSYWLHESINFYDNQKFTGKPAFTLQLKFVTFMDGEECRLTHVSETKKVKSWLACTPFRCTRKTSPDPLEVSVVNPFKLEWRKTSEPEKQCSRQLDVKIGKLKTGYSISSYLFLPISDGSSVSLGGKTYYGKMPLCNLENKCFISQSGKDGFGSFNRGMEEAKKSPPISQISELPTCKELIGPALKECLDKFTYKESNSISFRDDISYRHLNWGYRFEPVAWTEENIAEIKACIDQPHGLSWGMFKGINKKCFFINDKIAVIDYPEAFLEGEPMIDSRVYNIELEK